MLLLWNHQRQWWRAECAVQIVGIKGLSPSEATPYEHVKQTGLCCLEHVGWKDGESGRFREKANREMSPATGTCFFPYPCSLLYFMSFPLFLIDEHRRFIIISWGVMQHFWKTLDLLLIPPLLNDHLSVLGFFLLFFLPINTFSKWRLQW